MKTQRVAEINPQKGLELGIPAALDSANRLENFCYDAKTKSWSNMLGFEKFFSNQNDLGPFAAGSQRKVDSVYCFQQHNGARQTFFYETNGSLYALNLSTEGIVELKDSRFIKSPGQPHTSYEPFGRYVIITNGIDGPLKFRGSFNGDRMYDLGWRQQPGTPIVSNVGDPDDVPITFLDATDTTFNSQVWAGVDATFKGISGEADGDVTRHKYKVSFVNEAGSESPLSQESNEVKITADDITRGGVNGVPKTGAIIQIPTGPNGTLSRRIYRTKNDGNTFFFLKELKNNCDEVITDHASDVELGAEAPSADSSILMPSPACRFTATFKNSLFIDGGEMDPTRLYYSNPLQPDSYSANNFFEVGTREGGDITGLAPYYNSLLVFRENAIDLIRGDNASGFVLVPFIQGVGTLSPHTIVPIPNIGLSFMSQDGVYLLRGGLDGGADLKLEKISEAIQDFFDRASRDLLPAAVGAYSQKWRELHYYFCVDGQNDLNKGIVWHVDNFTWSERRDFPVSSITTDKDGNFICGYNDNNVYTGYSGGRVEGQDARGGLFVISGLRARGVEFTDVVPNTRQADPLTSVFRSAWHDFGLPSQKKYVKYVYLYCLTKGDNPLSLKYYKDRMTLPPNEVQSESLSLQRADHADQPVHDDDRYKWSKVYWQEKLLTQIRFDIHNAAVSEFCFEFETNEQIEFIGYSIEYQTDSKKTIQGKR